LAYREPLSLARQNLRAAAAWRTRNDMRQRAGVATLYPPHAIFFNISTIRAAI